MNIDMDHQTVADTQNDSISRLISPKYPPYDGDRRCFQFWYVLEGEDNGRWAII